MSYLCKELQEGKAVPLLLHQFLLHQFQGKKQINNKYLYNSRLKTRSTENCV